jgi:hypothetical protein
MDKMDNALNGAPMREQNERHGYLADSLSQPLRSINIEPLNRGYVVRVGCQTFAIGTKKLLLVKLTEYLTDPQGTESKWNKGELFK